ncbi:MAG TPA: ABC transporter permease [Streptosporangiaceae bacterium]|nr:ABC transporter permease [Streptosporangiaceae bacterium]
MSAQAGTVPRRNISLDSRLRATWLSEWIKFRSVRSGPLNLLVTAAIMLFGAWLLDSQSRGGWAAMSPNARATFDPVATTFQAIALAQLFIGALGVMTVTGEYSSGLIRGTFLATPQRIQVLAMKALVFALVVWAWCTALSFPAFFLGQSLLSSPAEHVGIGDPGVLTAVFGAGLYLTCIGLLGLFIGVLVRRTPAALAALFGLVAVLPAALALLPSKIGSQLGEYLPGNAGGQAWHLLPGGAYTLGHWEGLGVLAAYVAAAALAAFALIKRRDA